MHRLLAGVMVLALAGLLARAEDKPAKDKETKDKESKKEGGFKSLQKDLQAEVKEAKTPQDQAKVLQKYAKRFLEFAEKNPKDPDRFEALIWALRTSQGKFDKDTPGGKAIALIEKDYAKSEKIVPWVSALGGLGEEGAGILKAVMKENPDKKVQARAVKALARAYDQLAQTAARIKDNEKLRELAEKQRGEKWVKGLLANEDKYKKESKGYEKLLETKYEGVLPDLRVGKPMPDFTSQDLEGKKVKLSQLRGKVVVIDVWATWCGPCKAMIPHERKLVERLKGKPFTLVSISIDAKKETVKEFLKDNDMPWTHWWNGDKGGIVEDWEISSIPQIYVLDAKGVIRNIGPRGEALDKAVDALLEKMGVKVGDKEEAKEGKKEEKKEDKKDSK